MRCFDLVEAFRMLGTQISEEKETPSSHPVPPQVKLHTPYAPLVCSLTFKIYDDIWPPKGAICHHVKGFVTVVQIEFFNPPPGGYIGGKKNEERFGSLI